MENVVGEVSPEAANMRFGSPPDVHGVVADIVAVVVAVVVGISLEIRLTALHSG